VFEREFFALPLSFTLVFRTGWRPMFMRSRSLIFVALGLGLIACSTFDIRSISGVVRLDSKLAAGLVQTSSVGDASLSDIIPGQVIIKFKPDLQNQTIGSPSIGTQSFTKLSAEVAGQKVRLEPVRALGLNGVQLMRATTSNLNPQGVSKQGQTNSVLDARGTRELAAQLSARSDVEYAEPDRRIHALAAPNDPEYAQQWALSTNAPGRLNMPDAWSITTGSSASGPNPIVAIVDSGVMLTHPDLAGKILPGYDFISDPNIAADNDPPGPGSSRDTNPDDPGDDQASYHGTHVAGIAAALGNNRVGVAGVSWGARILPVRILGVGGGAVSDMIDAVLWAAGIDSRSVPAAYPHNPNKADVINLSVGGTGKCSSAEQDAFNQVIAAGTTVIVAAGNDAEKPGLGDAWTTDPASCSGVTVVGAVGQNGARAAYSNYGSRLDIMAPGGDEKPGGGILSTIKDPSGKPGYEYKFGTSMATPHVAGIIALMRSLRPKLTPSQIADLIKIQADAVNCSGRTGCGTGLIDAGAVMRAVRAASSVPQADFSVLTSIPVQSPNAATMNVSVRASAFNGFNANINLSAQTTPGITAQLSDTRLVADGPQGSSITLSLDMSRAGIGAHFVRLTGTSGGISRTVQLYLPVTLAGTLVKACTVTGAFECSFTGSKAITLGSDGSSLNAPFSIDNLSPGQQYQMLAWKDLNDDGLVNVGDLYGESGIAVTPPSNGVQVDLERLNSNAQRRW
jgi:serine protease